MAAFNYLLSVIFWVYLQVAIFSVAILSYLTFRLGHRFHYSLARLILRGLLRLALIKVRVDGEDGAGRLVLLANKPNLLATFALIAYYPQPIRFVAGGAIFKTLFLGRVLKAIGCIKAAENKQAAFRFAAEINQALRQGEPVMFYPANLRSWDGDIGPFRDEELIVAKVADAALLPIVLRGCLDAMPAGGGSLQPGTIRVMIKEQIGLGDGQDLLNVTQRLDSLYKEAGLA